MTGSTINITKQDIENVTGQLTLAYIHMAREFMLDVARETESDTSIAFEILEQEEIKTSDLFGIYSMIMHFMIDLSCAKDHAHFFFTKLSMFEHEVNQTTREILEEKTPTEDRIRHHAKNRMRLFFNEAKEILSPFAPEEITLSSNRNLDKTSFMPADNEERRPSITDYLLGSCPKRKGRPLKPTISSC